MLTLRRLLLGICVSACAEAAVAPSAPSTPALPSTSAAPSTALPLSTGSAPSGSAPVAEAAPDPATASTALPLSLLRNGGEGTGSGLAGLPRTGSPQTGSSGGTGSGAVPEARPNFPPAIVREGAPSVAGSLAADVIQRVVRSRMGAMKACYVRALKSNPTLKGRVSTEFTIGANGKVDTAALRSSDFREKSVVECVVQMFQRIRFPASETGPTRVIYPLVFDVDSTSK